MDRKLRLGANISSAALILALLASPVSAGHGGPHPAFSIQRVYFECPGPVANTGTWSSSQPGSVQEGNGCGNVLEPAGSELKALLCREVGICPAPAPAPESTSAGQADGHTLFVGAFAGNLRDMTLELHRFPNLPSTSSYRPGVSLSIDGRTIGLINGPVSPTGSGLTKRYEISIPELGCAREVLDDEGKVADVVTDGFVTENGAGSNLRHISILVEPGWWVWGASEFAAGITFNPVGPIAGAQYLPVAEDRADCGAG